jgi:short-subunit dehydrogenase
MVQRGIRCKRPTCCIINVSSLSAILTVPNLTVYSASKAYVTTFSSALATEYQGQVCISSIEPGTVKTDMCFNKHGGIGNPHPRTVAKGALNYVGTALSTFTPHYFHQARAMTQLLLPFRSLFEPHSLAVTKTRTQIHSAENSNFHRQENIRKIQGCFTLRQ